MSVTLDDIRAAAGRIRGHVVETPLVRDEVLSARLGQPVWLKCEYRQATGAFKLRGATNAILSLAPDALARGVVTASTGNHGRALAHAARALGVPATVCLSRLVPGNKVQAIRDLGATVRITGASQDEAMVEVARAVAQEGMTEIPPFDHEAVVAGQGTLGPEIAPLTPDAVLVPLSGGGLAAGVAVSIKALSPATRVIGLTMENGAAMAASLAAGHPVEVAESPSLADSLGGGIGLQNRVTFAICRDLLDDAILLTEAEIAEGIRHLGRAGHVVEGAASVGTAAMLAGKFVPQGPTVTILSGANIDPALHARIMAEAA
ncbi:hydroxyectoine utilization dehydratase EutB [Paracoccus denitrificans]|jgi:threonine dehydratase|uniref:Pyridoxal-5'-phosphate-dependent enzyme, beta subunit n=1 Tax=Paracoccus denitrificans (strain Pd 1222) TaxID=318586 RepID=A1AYQ5_PARDP|nr:hydroxyectoine utilization dehydratase EutB [Paracoccus denitrificans]ABL68399.1 Pyridoxal-5'-phosphate-dependent enzyme, beta subunit [Paracoccus denitrificans PD1222]MBB4627917.1 threonine dehydratase [Paracoccus denitrificans]MCU7428551.1 hydroxyectoine utilization dehydratase EutB [Paracoccus denitrificans]QAR26476.1 hydroxyectoine utilization dehydratase EutB [Paracoccus denitrificans]UPV95413.1 hydroxyectoine utilization dehydratase EutB [Paracoccus denitrificans]